MDNFCYVWIKTVTLFELYSLEMSYSIKEHKLHKLSLSHWFFLFFFFSLRLDLSIPSSSWPVQPFWSMTITSTSTFQQGPTTILLFTRWLHIFSCLKCTSVDYFDFLSLHLSDWDSGAGVSYARFHQTNCHRIPGRVGFFGCTHGWAV